MYNRKTYGVVRLDNVKSVTNGHIFSVLGEEEEILENGMVGNLGDYVEREKGGIKDEGFVEREIREFKQAEGNEEPIVLIAHSEIVYEQFRRVDNALEHFAIPAGVPARAYELQAGDTFSVSKKMIEALDEDKGAEIGNFVEPSTDEKVLKEVEEEPTGAFIGKVVRLDTLGTSTVVGQRGVIRRPIEFVAIEVKKNSL